MTSTPQAVSRQRGATLLIGLIMLVMITLMTIASFKIGKGNLEIMGNTQQRTQALAAAQAAIEQTISRPQFAETPADAIASPCIVLGARVVNTTCVDFYGDGVAKVKVTVAPACLQTKVIPNSSLDLASAGDAVCALGANQMFGTAGATNNNSLCADALWDIQAAASDPISGASSSINQGVSLRQAATTVCP